MYILYLSFAASTTSSSNVTAFERKALLRHYRHNGTILLPPHDHHAIPPRRTDTPRIDGNEAQHEHPITSSTNINESTVVCNFFLLLDPSYLRAKSVATPQRCLAIATTGLLSPSPMRDGRPAMSRSRMSILALAETPSSRFSA